MAKWKMSKAKPEKSKQHTDLQKAADRVFKDTKSEREKMTHNLDLYEGRMWDLESDEFKNVRRSDGPSDVQFNTFFANIQQIAPMVTANRPITSVAPRFAFLWKLGETLNHVIKWTWEYCDMQMLLFKGVIDSMIYGLAIFALDYRKDGPCIELVDPRDFFIAPGYDEIWKAPWCGTRCKKPLSWVRANFAHVKEIVPDDGDGSDDGSDDTGKAYKFGNTANPSEDTRFVTVTSFWIKDDETMEEFEDEDPEGTKTKKKRKKFPYGKMCYFTESDWLDEVVLEDEHGKPPWVEMWDYVRPHNFLPMSEIDQTEGLHTEINVLIKYISEYVRLNHAPNFLVDIYRLQDNTIEDLKEKLSLGNQIISWDSSGDSNPPIKQITEGQLNPMVNMWLALLLELIDIISGVTDPQRGMVGKKERQPATETAILKEAADTRVMQRSRNLEWTIKRLFKMILQLVMQYQDEPKQMSYQEGDGRVYSIYGNSYAQAKDMMTPQPLNESATAAQDGGIPQVGTNAEEQQRFQKEQADYDHFLSYFTNEDGEEPKDYDPIGFDFDIEVGTDSTLPKDRQSRSNQFLKLRSLGAIDILSLLEQMQIPGAERIAKRVKEEMSGGEQQQQSGGQAAQANPEQFEKYKAARAARSA